MNTLNQQVSFLIGEHKKKNLDFSIDEFPNSHYEQLYTLMVQNKEDFINSKDIQEEFSQLTTCEGYSMLYSLKYCPNIVDNVPENIWVHKNIYKVFAKSPALNVVIMSSLYELLLLMKNEKITKDQIKSFYEETQLNIQEFVPTNRQENEFDWFLKQEISKLY